MEEKKKENRKGKMENTREVPGIVFVEINLLDDGNGDGLRGALSAEVVKD